MGVDAWLTLVVLVVMVVLLATDRVPAAHGVFGATVVLLVLGVVESDQALSGFSATAPIAIAGLYVVAGAVEKTGAMTPLVDYVLRPAGGPRRRLGRVLVPAAALSGVLANTPIVAMLVPPIRGWCDRRGEAASKLLIPLSYAAIVGGVITLVGTSTNLVVSSILDVQGEPMGMFEITKIGLPVAVVGVVSIIVLAPWLMPDRRASGTDGVDESRQFTVSMRVVPGGAIEGRGVEEAGLRHLQGVYLVELHRDGRRIAPVGPEQQLEGDDVCVFVGESEQVVDLHQLRGLESAETAHYLAVDDGAHQFFEVVIGVDSPLNGVTLAEIGFRGRYQAAVVAVHRSGQRVSGKLGQIALRGGDTLLLLAGPDFKARMRNRRDFLLIARIGGHSPTAVRHVPVTLAVLTGVVALPVLGLVSLLEATLLGAFALIALGVLTTAEARAAISLEVVVMIGAAFGLGAAISESGLGDRIADLLLDTLGRAGRPGAVLAVVLVTMILTELITNAAAATVAVPIAQAVAVGADLDPRIMALAVAVSASCSFLTPIGYQTNTMVYGPGGYRYVDYLRLGVPLTLIAAATITISTLVAG